MCRAVCKQATAGGRQLNRGTYKAGGPPVALWHLCIGIVARALEARPFRMIEGRLARCRCEDQKFPALHGARAGATGGPI